MSDALSFEEIGEWPGVAQIRVDHLRPEQVAQVDAHVSASCEKVDPVFRPEHDVIAKLRHIGLALEHSTTVTLGSCETKISRHYILSSTL
jgi:hypothetical protein